MNRQERRFIKASLGAVFFVAIIGVAGMVTPFLVFFLYLAYLGGIDLVVQTWNGSPDVNHYTQLLDRFFMPVAFVGLIIGILLAIRLWNLLFVKSAYLDRHTLERIRAGSAPTLRMERARKTIGFSFLIPFLIWINWEIYLKPTEDWWIFLLTLPLLLYFIYHAVKEYYLDKR